MKRSLATLVLLSFCLLLTIPVSAQRLSKTNKTESLKKYQVQYNKIDAFSDGKGVWLQWETSYESGNLCFYVYRVVGDTKELVSTNLIPGGFLKTRDAQTIGEKYTFFDENGDYNTTYYIESLNINGQKQISNLIFPKYVSDLNAVAGSSSETLKNDSKKANPFILRDEAILPDDLQSEVNENRSQADENTQRLVAAQPGVKIGVKKEGFYRVSRAELQAGGFDVNAPTNFWQLYKDGVEQAINVGAGGDYIEFYGNGIDTRDTDTQIYFLIVGAQNGKRIGMSFRRPLAGRVLSNSYVQSITFKERTIYTQILNGEDEENFFGRVITNTPVTINLNVPAVDFSTATSSLDLKIQGATQVAHKTKVALNNVEIGFINGNDFTSMSKHFDFPTSILIEGANSLQLTTQNGSSDISLFDTVKINYSKRYQAQQNRLSFYVPNYKASYLDGFSSPNVRIFDITNPDRPTLISGLTVESNNVGGYRVYLPANRGRVIYAVEDTAVVPAASVKTNAPSTLSTTTHNTNLVIISYKDWMTEANNWANYRRSQGMSVEVINIDDVYDEFSFGAFSTNAIRGFLQYAYNNWQTPPGYVLLMGDATYNPRNYTESTPNTGAFNFIPTKIVETLYTETGSDEAMADFNNDGLAEIPIGRIPVHDGQTVTDVLNKVTLFEQNIGTQGISRGVIFASDRPDGYDFEGVSNRLRNQLPASVTSIMINRAEPNAYTRLITEMNNGRFLINYTGHGNVSAWASSPSSIVMRLFSA